MEVFPWVLIKQAKVLQKWIMVIILTLGILVGPARALGLEEFHGWSRAINPGQLCIYPVSHLVKAFWNKVKVFGEWVVETYAWF